MALFGWSRRGERQDALENVIGPSTSLRGHIKSDGGARIDGRFEGRIEVAGNVVVTERGSVVGDILARDVTIGGTVEGNIEGAGRLEILSTGKLFGDVVASAILIDDGGVFEGISRMRGAARPALPPPVDIVPALEEVVIDLDRRPEAKATPTVPPAESTLIVDAPAETVREEAKKGPRTKTQDTTPSELEPEAKDQPTAAKTTTSAAATQSSTPRVSKVAARLAAENGLDTALIRGTGHRGMVTKADVRRELSEQRRESAVEKRTAHPNAAVNVTSAKIKTTAASSRPEKERGNTSPIKASDGPDDKQRTGILDLSNLNIEPVIPDSPPRAVVEAEKAPPAPASSAPPTSKRAGARRSSRGRKRRR